MKYKKLFGYAILPILALVFVGANIVSAHGFGWFQNATPEEIALRQETMFERKADLLGVSTDVVKEGWADGLTLIEIAESNGISQDELKESIKENRQEKIAAHLETLVDQGVITQAQADERLAFMETRIEDGGFGKRFHRGGGFVF